MAKNISSMEHVSNLKTYLNNAFKYYIINFSGWV